MIPALLVAASAAPVPASELLQISGRVRGPDGAPPPDTVMISGAGGELAFTGPDGAYVMVVLRSAAADVPLTATLLDTGPCGDPGNCGISESDRLVAAVAPLADVLRAAGEPPVTDPVAALRARGGARWDPVLERPHEVVVHPLEPGDGWPWVTFSCVDPGRPERRASCASRGAAPTTCRCPPQATSLGLDATGLVTPLPPGGELTVDLRALGGVSGRLVAEPRGAHVLGVTPTGTASTFTGADGAFLLAPVALGPVHLWLERPSGRVDLGVVEAGSPVRAVGDVVVRE